MTVRDYLDYLETDSQGSPRKTRLLTSVEAIIHQMGYDWDTLPKDQWTEVYKHLNNLSPQMYSQYDKAIRDYYKWLEKQKVLAFPLSPYVSLEPSDIVEILAYQNQKKYLSTIDELIDRIENLQSTQRVTEKARLLNKVCMILIWVGLDISEMINLLESDVLFFDDNDSFLAEPKIADAISKISLLANDGAEKKITYTIINRRVISAIFELWDEAHTYRIDNQLKSAPLFVAEGAGKRAGDKAVLTESSLTMRINRIIKAINKTYDLDLDVRSIRASAVYHSAYTQWKMYSLPTYCTPQTIGMLFKFLKKEVPDSSAAQRIEFQKFLEYARTVKKDPLDR